MSRGKVMKVRKHFLKHTSPAPNNKNIYSQCSLQAQIYKPGERKYIWR